MGSVKAESSLIPIQQGSDRSSGRTGSGYSLPVSDIAAPKNKYMVLAYTGAMLFMVVYCLRPEDWIPFLDILPLAKICGFLAIAGFLYSWMTEGRGGAPFPRELVYLILLFVHLVFCIPFAIWIGGSFQVVILNFSEVVILTIVLALCVNTLERLRQLMFIQCASLAVITAITLTSDRVLHNREQGITRVVGAVGGIFENPNDLAVAIAMALPLCLLFLIRGRGFFRKAIWAVAMMVLTRAILATYSRSGLLALVGAALVVLYEFGIKGRRPQLFVYVLLGLAGLMVFGGPSNYGARLATILQPDTDPTGSAQERRELLKKSIQVTVEHPIFGIGPGDFPMLSGRWLVTHNTYTQLSAEAGLPGLLLFLLLFKRTLKNIRAARNLVPENQELQLIGAGLRASVFAYLVGSFFASTAYHFFPYFLVAYGTAFYSIARKQSAPALETAPTQTPSRLGRIGNATEQQILAHNGVR